MNQLISQVHSLQKKEKKKKQPSDLSLEGTGAAPELFIYSFHLLLLFLSTVMTLIDVCAAM